MNCYYFCCFCYATTANAYAVSVVAHMLLLLLLFLLLLLYVLLLLQVLLLCCKCGHHFCYYYHYYYFLFRPKTKFWLKTRCQLLCIGRRHDDVSGQWTPISILCVDVHMGLDPPPLPSTCVQPDSFSPSVWTS